MRLFIVGFLALMFAGCSPTQQTDSTPTSPTPNADTTCEEIVTQALQTVDDVCTQVGRNQACYGSRLVNAEFQVESPPAFDAIGDIADLNAFSKITTAPLDTVNNIWGVAVIKAQANLPDTLPGQNVTFLIYGDAVVEGITPELQAVTIRTGTGGETACDEVPDSAVLLQSPEGTQSTLTINGASVTMGSTLHITANEGAELSIATIEGTAVVSAFNATRIASAGAQIRLQLGGADNLQVVGPPSDPEPFDVQTLTQSPLPLLERPVSVGSPIPADSTPFIPTEISCAPRSDWASVYTVQRGDTLATIAQAFGVTVEELQTANCIADANDLQAGQTLTVPFELVVNTATPPPTQAAPPTATGPNLRADSTLLQPGECTTVRWDAQDAQDVFFEGQPVSASSTQQVCPTASATYTLLVITNAGQQLPFTVRIEVARPS